MSLMRIQFLYCICVLGSYVWLQSYIRLNSVLGRVCVWIDVTSSPWRVVLEEKSRSALFRGLGSVPYILLARLSIGFVRLA